MTSHERSWKYEKHVLFANSTFLIIFIIKEHFSLEMGRKKQITPRKRAIIQQYHKDGLRQREICKRLKLNKSTVCRLVQHFSRTGSSEAKKSTGRPRITSKRDDIAIGRSARVNPTYSSTQIMLDSGVHASTRTIRRRLLKEFGLAARRAAKKPLLTDQQRRKRLKFCKERQHWTVENWKKVLFTDETLICQFGSPATFVRRPKGERFNARYTIRTTKHSPKVMVWGSFSYAGRGSLYFVDQGQTVNAEEYKKILTSKVPITMRIHNCQIFQQDSAPAHTAKSVRQWFTSNGIQVLEWPGNSPDLNPIENLWQVLKQSVRRRHPKNMNELKHCIKQAWCLDISRELCENLIRSMPNRCKTVIQSKGHITKY